MPRATQPPILDSLHSAAASRVLLVACDFDSALIPAGMHPEEAFPAASLLRVLVALAQLPRTSCCIVSRRALADLWSRVPILPGVCVFGSHGGEGPGCEVAESIGRIPEIRALAARLASLEPEHPAVRVERKSYGVAIHTLNVPELIAERVRQAAAAIVSGAGDWTVHLSRHAVDFSILRRRKHERILAERQRLFADSVVYAGAAGFDDSVFEALQASDVAIRVGPAPAAATEVVRGPRELGVLLRLLCRLRRRSLVFPEPPPRVQLPPQEAVMPSQRDPRSGEPLVH